MYNEGRKTAFIAQCGMDTGKFHWAASVFNSVQHLEEELDRDIAEMSAEEVGQALASPDIVSSSTIVNRVPFISRYKEWCAEQGFPSVQVVSADVRVDISENMRDSMVCSGEMLAGILHEAFRDRSENDSKCIYRAHLWLGYAGMQDLDSVRVRVSDVDFNQNAVFFENRMYFFPEHGARDIRHACNMQVFQRAGKDKTRTFRRAEGDKVLRGRISVGRTISDRDYLVKTLRPAIRVGLTATGHAGMSYLRVRKSGIFREAFKREIKGIPVNFYQVGHDDYVFDGRRETPGQTKQKILRRIILAYEKDYEAWKRAFEPELKEEFGLGELPHQFSW